MTTTTGRSNRMHTQRILSTLERFLLLRANHDDRQIRRGISGKARCNYDTYVWELYYEGMFLLNVERDEEDNLTILVTIGGYLDKHMNATRTTRELTNGVLDLLESWGYISHSRMFVEDNHTYVRTGDTTVQLGLKQQYLTIKGAPNRNPKVVAVA